MPDVVATGTSRFRLVEIIATIGGHQMRVVTFKLLSMLCRSLLCRSLMIGLLVALGGCQLFVDEADREIYRLIDHKQRKALAETRSAPIDKEHWPEWNSPPENGPDMARNFAPHSIDSKVPPVFNTIATQPATVPATEPGDEEQNNIFVQSPESQPVERQAASMDLADFLRYAFEHSREYQNAKEDLYLAALALSLERYLWTPRMMSEIQSRYANYGQIRDFDHAMDAVSTVAVQQKLPYGGDVTAKVINNLMRDLTRHLTSGENGSMVLEANIPLLRGAGPTAFESRYQAERDLIYAVRTFERYRRVLTVSIASDYFNLQQLKAAIVNEIEGIKSFTAEAARARALWRTGRRLQLEVQRAEQDQLSSISRKIDAIEEYQSALDAFKIRIGMPVNTRIDVEDLGEPSSELTTGGNEMVAQSLEESLRMPAVPEEEAVRVALKYRLDLLNDLDQIDDTRRNVNVAENQLLPDLAAHGSVTMNTNPAELGSLKYNTERTTWRGSVDLELPLDRKQEQVNLRKALIVKRRAERNYEQSRETVELQVRRAMRRVQQQQDALRIQILNRDLALQRRQSAKIRFDQGRVSNREVTDAENALLAARNRLARAQAQVRLAILEFRRDTETLRVNEEGAWAEAKEAKVAGESGRPKDGG